MCGKLCLLDTHLDHFEMEIMFLFVLLFSSLSPSPSLSRSSSIPLYDLTREEAAHIGYSYTSPSIINQFQLYQSKQTSSSSSFSPLLINDFTLHHSYIQKYCLQSKGSCSWNDYHTLLEEIRQPFLNYFDPGIEEGQQIQKIQKKYQSGSKYQTKCQVIRNPTADQFLQYVIGSKPVIIRGTFSKSFNRSLWTLQNLQNLLGKTEVFLKVDLFLSFLRFHYFLLGGCKCNSNR